ncbi:hypothetical protein [Tengunoibacter tsumagoiensis]|uniref:Uncharacterized protein n=1 Tax=Tengunoibacter tsumagoiensis TaxID=2014871 RepID=A0A401ZY64_9CHLR|nr:hypothetical protein [Tengunoibacter tsumagoiensis]GCE11808.1 hypothetical protein KTT_16670 [Tengunoibacter tsumagoiensis]
MDTLASTFVGALQFEFAMQIRRRVMWVTFFFFAIFVYALAGQGNWSHWQGNRSATDSFADWTVVVNLLLPIAVGVLLADRLRRDKSTRVDELLYTVEGSLGGRLVGKYLGSILATLIPFFLVYLGGMAFITYHWAPIEGFAQALTQWPVALAMFLAVVVPGALFVAGFSIAVPFVVWVPLYQLLFVCYWFWGNALEPGKGIPTLSNTILTPFGAFMLAGFFGADSGMVIHKATAVQGLASLILLIVLGFCAILAVWQYIRWHLSR